MTTLIIKREGEELFDLYVDGALMLSEETLEICEGVSDALLGKPWSDPTSELAEVAASIKRHLSRRAS